MAENVLYYGDNLEILRDYIKDESVDLIYLDPPFKSNQAYNVLFEERNGSRSKAQIKAFEDTWRWDMGSAEAYQEIVENGPVKVSQTMQGLRSFLGDNDMMAYLSMMALRLVELRRVLKPTGSIYLHCDPTASHYLKIVLDGVFGAENFLNELIWHYRKWPTGKYKFQRNHDVVFFYSRTRSRERIFNQLFMPRAASTLKRFGKATIVSGYDEAGRRVPSQVKDSESLGVRQDDVWNIGRVPPIKQLFPTEKPIPLLQRIIHASTNEQHVVLDPFCGCGTAIVVAHQLKRKWIGIDITHLAITLVKNRLKDSFGKDFEVAVVGAPVSLPDAEALAQQDREQFEWWVLGLVDAQPAERKKGADRGIDGRLYFHDEPEPKKTKQVIVQVKSGHVGAAVVRDLRGVLEREKGEIAALITLKRPTKDMNKEAASAGFYEVTGLARVPRIQILTIEELLAGKQINYPGGASVTFKRGKKVSTETQLDL
jgi:DNA modification methylase